MARAQEIQVEELCEQADPESPIEHLIVCPGCGQIFDCREDELVAHHSQSEHGPRLS